MFKRLFKIKRYFICSYHFKTGSGVGNGSMYFTNNNGCFPNRKELEKHLKFREVAIMNIIEISKKDYLDYSKN